MQDKLIEAAAKAIFEADTGRLWSSLPSESDTTRKYRLLAVTAVTAVRAHDAGTDACLHTRTRFMCATGWKCSECGDVKPFVKGDVSTPASHAAESTAQLDAEGHAEPVEDVVIRMCELMGGCACEHCIKRMTAALAVAREGYWSQQAVEKAIRAVWKEHYHSQAVWSKEEFLSKLMARLAPKPSPLSTGYTGGIMPEAYGVRCNRCGVFVDDQIMHDQWHAALFPKTGGAK